MTAAVASAVVSGGDVDVALGLPRCRDWPHADTADALRPLAEHPEHTSDGTFLICRDGVVVGDCGWFGPPVDGEVEIGYGVAASARGRGVGTAAVRLLLAWVAERGALVVRAEARPGNEPSLRLLTGLGFAIREEAAGHLVLTLELS